MKVSDNYDSLLHIHLVTHSPEMLWLNFEYPGRGLVIMKIANTCSQRFSYDIFCWSRSSRERNQNDSNTNANAHLYDHLNDHYLLNIQH